MLKNDLRDHLAQRHADANWLDCLRLSQDGQTVRVGFPHRYYAAWFDKHKRTLLEETLAQLSGGPFHLLYEQEPTSPPADPRPFPDCPSPMPQEGSLFATFFANEKNSLTLATAQEMAKRRTVSESATLLLCGGGGTGKTHVLRAMFAELTGTGRRTLLTTAARFCADSGLWAHRPELFWRHCGALLLDDVQDITGQEDRQRQLAVCLDARPRGVGGPLLAAAFSGPRTALATLSERLRSRLECGVTLELAEPDLDVRLRYLQHMSKARGLDIPNESLLSMARRCQTFSTLQGALQKIEAFRTVAGGISPQDLEFMLKADEAAPMPGCMDILAAVAQAMRLSPDEVMGGGRRPDLVLARQLAMYICRRKLGLSYPELGRAFGGKDHSTVIHAVRKIQKLLIGDKSVQKLVTSLELKAQ